MDAHLGAHPSLRAEAKSSSRAHQALHHMPSHLPTLIFCPPSTPSLLIHEHFISVDLGNSASVVPLCTMRVMVVPSSQGCDER